jgi:hypothetical protein
LPRLYKGRFVMDAIQPEFPPLNIPRRGHASPAKPGKPGLP